MSLHVYNVSIRGYVPFIKPHILCNKCFQMEDLLASCPAPVLVESRPFDDLWFQSIICLWDELPCQGFDNGR